MAEGEDVMRFLCFYYVQPARVALRGSRRAEGTTFHIWFCGAGKMHRFRAFGEQVLGDRHELMSVRSVRRETTKIMKRECTVVKHAQSKISWTT